MDDPVILSENDIRKIAEAMTRMNEAMDSLGIQMNNANDILYTSSRGGTSYTIDTSVYEQEAEDDVDFLKETRD